jgi:hypothetical protein
MDGDSSGSGGGSSGGSGGSSSSSSTTGPPSFGPIIITIVGLTIGIGVLIARMERTAVMGNWAQRRCDPFIMFAGAFYKPDDDPRTAAAFSSDNFQFCLKEMQRSAMGKALAAPMSLFKSQVDAANTISQAQNSDKLGIANLLRGVVVQILGDFYGRMRMFGDQFARIIQRFGMAYERVAAAVNSIAFMGLSLMQGIFNAYNTIILIVIIILGIIAGMFIIFFFALAPFVPMLLTAVSVIAAAGFAVGPLGDVFCFAGDTLVEMADGRWLTVADLQLGTVLAGGGIVEGMFVMDGSLKAKNCFALGEPSLTQMWLVADSGVIVSGDHLLYNRATREYCAVRDHPSASASASAVCCAQVFCPVISNRSLHCRGASAAPASADWFRDWEEIEEESESAWHSLIAGMLGSSAAEPADRSAGLSGSCKVYCRGKGRVSIRDVVIGDYVLAADADADADASYTRVIGTAVMGSGSSAATAAGLGPGTWIHDGSGWAHPLLAELSPATLYNLITESGTLCVQTAAGTRVVARDALEVGWDRIAETYEFTMSELRKTDSHPPNR